MHETTLRVFSALRERTRDEDAEDYQTLNEIARDAGLTLDEAANALDRLSTVGAVDSTEDDEMVYRPRDVTVGTVADRMAALHRVPDDRRDEVVERLKAGEIDPASLPPIVEALGIGSGGTTARDTEGTADGASDTADASESEADSRENADRSTASPIERLVRFVPGS